jgi:hypothetical protein
LAAGRFVAGRLAGVGKRLGRALERLRLLTQRIGQLPGHLGQDVGGQEHAPDEVLLQRLQSIDRSERLHGVQPGAHRVPRLVANGPTLARA